jgi:hypothetical protein
MILLSSPKDASTESPSPPDAAPLQPSSELSEGEASLGPAPVARLEPLSGSPGPTERPEKKRGRRAEKNPAGQGIAAQHAFPEARFPVWARIDASRRSERRRAAAEHFERSQTEEPVDRRSLDQSSAEGLPERRGFARRESEEREREPALEPPAWHSANPAERFSNRILEGRALRVSERGSRSDVCGEEFGPSRKGRGPDIGREALSATAGTAPEALEAAFLAGAALAALDSVARAEAPWRGAWSARLALSAASASARLLGRGEDEAALRDAFALRRPGDDPGPAGRLLAAWRRAASCRPDLVFERDIAEKIIFDLGLPRSGPVLKGIEEAAALAKSEQPAVFAAAEAAARTFRALAQDHGREAEIFSLLLADAVLAYRLRWPVLVPFLAGVIFDPALRRGPEGKRPRPDDPDWSQICCLAVTRAAAPAHDLARDLARRSEKLEAALPSLRTKGAAAAVAKILAEDAVGASMRPGNLSERAARRLFDRLVSFGVVRELTGRPTFRLYGL